MPLVPIIALLSVVGMAMGSEVIENIAKAKIEQEPTAPPTQQLPVGTQVSPVVWGAIAAGAFGLIMTLRK